MRSCNSAISPFGAAVRMVNERVTGSSGQRKLPEAGERVLTSDRIGLLATLDHLPLVERRQRRRSRASCPTWPRSRNALCSLPAKKKVASLN